MEPVEGVRSLTSSECRVNILELLSEHDSLRKQELRSNLESSRTTVGRNVEALDELGWVDGVGSEYSITRPGRLIAEKFGELAAAMEVTEELDGFLEWVPDGSLDIDLGLLSDADVILAEPGDPWAMINRHVTAIKQVDEFRATVPFTGIRANEEALKSVKDGSSAELILEPDIAELYRSNPEYSEIRRESEATGRFEYMCYQEEFPFGLGIFDDTVQIIVAEGDQPRALLETDSEPVHDWAVEKYESYEADAERLVVE